MKTKVCVIVFLFTFIACKKHNDGTRNDNEIWLHNSRVEPYEVEISKGTTLTFINKDPKTHTASEVNNKFYSGKLKSGESYSYTFNDTGYYAFICNYQNSMLGKIVVK